MSATFTVAISGGTEVADNDTESISITADDLLSLQVIPNSTPDVVDSIYAMTGFITPTSEGRRLLF